MLEPLCAGVADELIRTGYLTPSWQHGAGSVASASLTTVADDAPVEAQRGWQALILPKLVAGAGGLAVAAGIVVAIALDRVEDTASAATVASKAVKHLSPSGPLPSLSQLHKRTEPSRS